MPANKNYLKELNDFIRNAFFPSNSADTEGITKAVCDLLSEFLESTAEFTPSDKRFQCDMSLGHYVEDSPKELITHVLQNMK